MNELDQQIQNYRKAYKILAKNVRRKHIEEKIMELKQRKKNLRQAAKYYRRVAESSDDEEPVRKNKEKPQKQVLNTYNCKVCETNYRTAENLRLHEKTHLFRTKKKWSCGTCLYNFLTEARLKMHKCKGKDASDDELIPLDQLYSCRDCFAAYKKVEDLAEHRKVNHLTNFVCNVCSKSFMFKVALEKHMLVHTLTKEYHCKLCNKICRTESALKTHNVIHQKDILNVAVSVLQSKEDVVPKDTTSRASTDPKPAQAQKNKRKRLLTDDHDIEEVEPNTEEVPTFNLECVDGDDTVGFSANTSLCQDDTEETPSLNKTTLATKKSKNSRQPIKDNFQPVVKVLKLPALEKTINAAPIKLAVPVNLQLGSKKPQCQLCYESFNTKEELIDHIEIHLGRRIELRSNPKSSTTPSPKKGKATPSPKKGKAPSTKKGKEAPSTKKGKEAPSTKKGKETPSTKKGKEAPSTKKDKETRKISKKKKGKPVKAKNVTGKTEAKTKNSENPGRQSIITKIIKDPKTNEAPKKKRGRAAKSITQVGDSRETMCLENDEQGTSEFPPQNNTVFDPTYIIKVEPEESSDSEGEIDLTETFIVVKNEKGNQRVKLSDFVKTLNKLSIDLTLNNMLV